MEKSTSKIDFPTLVEKNFDFLFNEGYYVKSKEYSGFPLAEWAIVLCSQNLSIEILIDKAYVELNLTIPGKEDIRLDLMFVMVYLSNNEEWKYPRLKGEINTDFYNKQLERLSTILRENLAEIEGKVIKIVTDPQEKRKFDKFARKHFDKLTLDL